MSKPAVVLVLSLIYQQVIYRSVKFNQIDVDKNLDIGIICRILQILTGQLRREIRILKIAVAGGSTTIRKIVEVQLLCDVNTVAYVGGGEAVVQYCILEILGVWKFF